MPETETGTVDEAVETPAPRVQATLAQCNSSFMAGQRNRRPQDAPAVGRPLTPDEARTAIAEANIKASEIIADAQAKSDAMLVEGEAFAREQASARIEALTLEVARGMVSVANAKEAEAAAAAAEAVGSTEETAPAAT